jgi:hypothetical protein
MSRIQDRKPRPPCGRIVEPRAKQVFVENGLVNSSPDPDHLAGHCWQL